MFIYSVYRTKGKHVVVIRFLWFFISCIYVLFLLFSMLNLFESQFLRKPIKRKKENANNLEIDLFSTQFSGIFKEIEFFMKLKIDEFVKWLTIFARLHEMIKIWNKLEAWRDFIVFKVSTSLNKLLIKKLKVIQL